MTFNTENNSYKSKKKLSDNYLLVTPAKNEEQNLQTLIYSIINQTLIPRIWVIIDDSSEDNTRKIIEKAVSSFPWIQGIYLNDKNGYDLEMHYSKLCQMGFRFAIENAIESEIEYDFIALSDADAEYPSNYFYAIIEYLNENEDCGIVSGKMLIKDKDNQIYSESREIFGNEMPLGTGRLWRRIAFEETNGYLDVRAPDVVSNILATKIGWKTKQITTPFFFQTRDTGGKISIWDGHYKRGKRAYYLSANIFCIFNTIVEISLFSRQKKSIVKSVAYLCGYLHSFIHKDSQISINYVNEYMGSYKRVFAQYIRLFKMLMKNSKGN